MLARLVGRTSGLAYQRAVLQPRRALSADPIPILSQAVAHQENVAVVSSGGTEYTYAALLRGADRLASELSGPDRSDLSEGRVAYMCPPGAGYVTSKWGAWAAGATAVPLHPGHPDAELEYVLQDSAPVAVVAHEDYHDRVEPMAQRLGLRCVRLTRGMIDEWTAGAGVPEHFDRPGTAGGSTTGAETRRALIIYTSGTTGRPKGAVHTHGGVTAQIQALVEAWQYRPTDRIPHFLPLHHTHGIVNKLLCTLWAGGCVEFAPNAKASTLLELLTGNPDRPPAEQLTLFMAVPTIYALLAKELREVDHESREAARRGMETLRLMVSGSAACPVPLMQEWEQLTGHVLLERYGMTEVGMALSNALTSQRFPGFVGLPLPGVRVRLVDDNDAVLTECSGSSSSSSSSGGGGSGTPVEAAGLLEISGPTVFLEYWRNPEATAKEFTEDGWFKTGDVAEYCADPGAFKINGRASVDIIKSGGYKISALDVERALLECSLVEQAAVLGLNDDVWGEKIGAIIVLSTEGAALGTDEGLTQVREWMESKVASYKVPRTWLVQDEIPKNAMGKVMKKTLKPLFDE